MKISIIYWTRSIRCMTNTKGGIKMSKFKENDEVWIENDLGLDQGIVKGVGAISGVGPVYSVETCDGDELLVRESALDYQDLMNAPIEEYEESSFSVDDYFTEMATVKGGFMSIKIAIYGSEGRYPHFHFYKGIAPEQGISKDRRNGGGCICIETPNYFIHGRHTEKMDRKEIDALISFLKSPHKLLKQHTNWEYIISEWDQNNPEQKQLPIDLPIPDYRHDMSSIQEK